MSVTNATPWLPVSACRSGGPGPLPIVGAVRSRQYGPDLTPPWKKQRPAPEVAAVEGLVVEEVTDGFCGAVVRCEKTAQGVLARARGRADMLGVQSEAVYVADAQPAEAIIETAEHENCDLFVMASHGRGGLGRLLLDHWRGRLLNGRLLPGHLFETGHRPAGSEHGHDHRAGGPGPQTRRYLLLETHCRFSRFRDRKELAAWR